MLLTLRRVQLYTFRDAGYVGALSVSLYDQTPIDIRGYLGHRDFEELEKYAALEWAPSPLAEAPS